MTVRIKRLKTCKCYGRQHHVHTLLKWHAVGIREAYYFLACPSPPTHMHTLSILLSPITLLAITQLAVQIVSVCTWNYSLALKAALIKGDNTRLHSMAAAQFCSPNGVRSRLDGLC